MKGMLTCGGCGKTVKGRMVYFGGSVWHPGCAAKKAWSLSRKIIKLKPVKKSRARKSPTSRKRRKR